MLPWCFSGERQLWYWPNGSGGALCGSDGGWHERRTAGDGLCWERSTDLGLFVLYSLKAPVSERPHGNDAAWCYFDDLRCSTGHF